MTTNTTTPDRDFAGRDLASLRRQLRESMSDISSAGSERAVEEQKQLVAEIQRRVAAGETETTTFPARSTRTKGSR